MKALIVCLFMMVLSTITGPEARAYEPGALYADPYAAVGYNPIQGTSFRLGLDLGYGIHEQMAAGVGAYFAAGERPSHDREIGAGPFVSFFQPLTGFLFAHIRQEINYVDLFYPYKKTDLSGEVTYDHTHETGVISATTLGGHLSFTRNFGVSAGYRAVLALSNTALDDDRSGWYFGFSLGI
ncbi:MAG: hypothetical protein HC902_15015 [Calothrix sp. SM1_5_4]|nr:hypothetical protein [Calothrix sp. SM1_5_4]